jgi:hypothetical protein
MIIIPHMLVGAAIGARVRNIWSVFVLVWLSHYLLDFLPHWDYLDVIDITNPDHLLKIGLDFIIGIILLMVLVSSYSNSRKWLISAGLIIAFLPDVLNVFYYSFDIEWLSWLVSFHRAAHYWKGLSFWQGMSATVIVSLMAIFVLVCPKTHKS